MQRENTPTSGRRWTQEELDWFKISVVNQGQDAFLGRDLPMGALCLPGFWTYASKTQIPPEIELDKPSHALFNRLSLAMTHRKTEEPAVRNFASELLRVIGYESRDGRDTVVCSRNTHLHVSGDPNQYAKRVLYVVDMANPERPLFIQENETLTHLTDGTPGSSEAQLIAEAIACAQKIYEREGLGASPITIHAVLMLGTFPIFYKIPVSAALVKEVGKHEKPKEGTAVFRYMAYTDLKKQQDGMLDLQQRQHLIACYLALKSRFVFAQD